MMDFTLNRALSKKVVRDSRFYCCIRITYQGEHYGKFGFWEGWEGYTPLKKWQLKTETIKKKTINTIKHRAEPIQSKQSMLLTDVLIDLIETFDRSKQY
jgi:hypothetical protein